MNTYKNWYLILNFDDDSQPAVLIPQNGAVSTDYGVFSDVNTLYTTYKATPVYAGKAIARIFMQFGGSFIDSPFPDPKNATGGQLAKRYIVETDNEYVNTQLIDLADDTPLDGTGDDEWSTNDPKLYEITRSHYDNQYEPTIQKRKVYTDASLSGDGSEDNPLTVVGGGISEVAHDETLEGDGTEEAPLTTGGGIGAPREIAFTLRSGGISGTTQFFAMALNGAIGSGGFTSQDPTWPESPSGWVPGFALQLPKGELSNFHMGLANGPGDGETLDFSIRLNNADPVDGLLLQFSGDSGGLPVFGVDDENVVAVPQDGYVAIKAIASGGASYGGATGTVLFTPKP